MKRSARLSWYGLVVLLGLIGSPLVFQGMQTLVEGAPLWPLGLLILGVWLGLHRTVRLGKGDYHSVYTLDDAPTFAIIFLSSTPVATAAVTSVRLVYETARLLKGLRRHRDRVTLANVAYHFSDVVFVGFATMLAGTALDMLGRPSPMTGLAGATAALLAGSLWFLALFLLNALHVSVAQDQPETWLQRGIASIRSNAPHAALFLPLGVLVSVFVEQKPWLVPLLFVPVVLIHAVMEASEKLEQETQATILALSTYLEERDDYTSGHSNRVAGYAAAMARQIGLSAQEVETAHRAGIIHDLGKIDVPDAILRKPGFLTEEERAVMRTHTDRAVSLGQKLVALKDGLPFGIAAYHHENWDGTGHFGLAGEAIPLVSRMLAVADTWDAMTSDRPYRKGMEDSEAILRLKKAAGTQLDPRMVTAFLETYDQGDVDRVRRQFPALKAARVAVAGALA